MAFGLLPVCLCAEGGEEGVSERVTVHVCVVLVPCVLGDMELHKKDILQWHRIDVLFCVRVLLKMK